MLAQHPEGLLVDFKLVRELVRTVEEILLHRPLRQLVIVPELHRVIDVVQDGELGLLRVGEHLVVVGRIQRNAVADPDTGLAVQHLDAVKACLLQPLDLPQQLLVVRHLVAIVVEGAEGLTPSALPQLHQGAEQVLTERKGHADHRARHERPVLIAAEFHHLDAVVNVLRIKQVDVNIVNGISKQHGFSSVRK